MRRPSRAKIEKVVLCLEKHGPNTPRQIAIRLGWHVGSVLSALEYALKDDLVVAPPTKYEAWKSKSEVVKK